MSTLDIIDIAQIAVLVLCVPLIAYGMVQLVRMPQH